MWEQQVLQPSHQIQVQKQQKSQAHRYSSRPQKHQGGSRRCQRNLMSYFQPSVNLPQTSPAVDLPRLPLVGTLVTPKTQEEDVIARTVAEQTKVSEVKDKKAVQTLFWKSVLSGPSPTPLCRGHREPRVMRIVKKTGPNMGRHFYTCARPQGPPNDPSSSCNFFLWSRPSWTNWDLSVSGLVSYTQCLIPGLHLLSCLPLRGSLPSSAFSPPSSCPSFSFPLRHSSSHPALSSSLSTWEPATQEVIILNSWFPRCAMYLLINKICVFVSVLKKKSGMRIMQWQCVLCEEDSPILL